MKLLQVILMTLAISTSAYAELSISTVSGTEKENHIKRSLEKLLDHYDVTDWVYTQTVQVDEGAKTPHSHPVLTMSTRPAYMTNETTLLSAFLHEQFHWHLILNGNGSKEAFRARIEEVFPNPQWKHPYGSGRKGGTLSHLVVCYLEYKALSHLVGEEKAQEDLAARPYYTWVYEKVLDEANKPAFENLLDGFGLQILRDQTR